MNVGELKKALGRYPDDLDVFYKFRPSVGTIGEIFNIHQDEYGFFGKVLPCVLLDSVSPEEDEDG